MTRHIVSETELAAALAAGQVNAETEVRAHSVRYVADRDAIEIVTTSHAGFLIPRGWIAALQGVVQIRVTPKARYSCIVRALLISGVTWEWHLPNHARSRIDVGWRRSPRSFSMLRNQKNTGGRLGFAKVRFGGPGSGGRWKRGSGDRSCIAEVAAARRLRSDPPGHDTG